MTSFWDNLPQPFFILAPMEAVTDVVFRHVVKQAGAPDVFFTEFANATGWVHAGDKAIAGRLVKTDDEHPLVAQIWGGEPGDMEQFAAHCMELGFDGIDINMGCPAKSAIKSGGAALIRRPEIATAAIAAAKTAGLPVSVKTRLGYTHVDEWREWLTIILRQDIVNLTIHLRTKKEMSKVPAHYELISNIVAIRDEIAPQTLLTINGRHPQPRPRRGARPPAPRPQRRHDRAGHFQQSVLLSSVSSGNSEKILGNFTWAPNYFLTVPERQTERVLQPRKRKSPSPIINKN